MNATEVLLDGFRRVGPGLHRCLDGLPEATLTRRVDPEANTLAWLAWHIAREIDAQVAPLAGTEQVWTAQRWYQRSGLTFGPAAMGYGQTADQVAQVVLPADQLLGYYDATEQAAAAYLTGLTDTDLDDVVDERWDPPVTRGVRLVSVLADALAHLGQAHFLRGVLDRTASDAPAPELK